MAIRALSNIRDYINPAKEKGEGLNTFYGVFLPSLLSIFGVIMYLRLGAIVGSVGIFGALFIVVFSSIITFITSLSISATATNSHVGSGGAYYMISRAFGIEIGSAIGIALYLAQVVGLAFFIEGFSESVLFLFPSIDPFMLEGGTLLCIATLALSSSHAALKMQLMILFVIIASLFSIFWGASLPPENEVVVGSGQALTFWGAFALFFPAVTGIEAGFSMSGDLKDPKRALPLGTIAAVVTGFIVYVLLCLKLSSSVSYERLVADPMVILHSSKSYSLVILGIWGATLSSAIGGLMGAPRTLQALAKDGIVPNFFGKAFGEAKEPRVATAFTFMLACLCLFFGSINVIAPVLSMFFLISYGMLNLASGIESFLENPSWRPTFATPAILSLSGACLCLFAMLMIDPGATFLSLFVIFAIYSIVKRRKFSKEWEDIHQGTLLFFARFAIYRLSGQNTSLRSWRPNFLVFCRSPTHRLSLLQFAGAITNNKGFMTTATLLSSETASYEKAQHMETLIREYFKKNKIQSLVEVTTVDQTVGGMKKIVTSYGLGPIAPNTVVIGYSQKSESLSNIVDLIAHSYHLDKSVIIIKDSEESKQQPQREHQQKPTIDIWWDEEERKNNELMLLLAYMMRASPLWRKDEVNIKCVVPNENAREMRLDYFNNFFSLSRLDVNAQVLVVPEEQEQKPETIPLFCSKSAFLFVGLPKPPLEKEGYPDYLMKLQKLMQSVKTIPRIAFVLNANEVKLDQIFEPNEPSSAGS